MIKTNTPVRPMDVVAMDLIGPLELTENGNRYALTLQCELSKYLIMKPVPNKEAKTIARALVENAILVYGPMKELKTDQGTENVNEIMREILDLLRVEHKQSTAYHPQTIGALERTHRVLNEYLRTFMQSDRHQWDHWLPYFSFAYNTTPHTAHDYTPFELMFGRQPKIQPNVMQSLDPLYNYDSYSKELKYGLQIAWKRAHNLLDIDKRNRIDKQTKINSLDLNVGDSVKLLEENRHKLDSHYTGPYTVTAVNGPNVTITNGRTSNTVHKNRLKTF